MTSSRAFVMVIMLHMVMMRVVKTASPCCGSGWSGASVVPPADLHPDVAAQLAALSTRVTALAHAAVPE